MVRLLPGLVSTTAAHIFLCGTHQFATAFLTVPDFSRTTWTRLDSSSNRLRAPGLFGEKSLDSKPNKKPTNTTSVRTGTVSEDLTVSQDLACFQKGCRLTHFFNIWILTRIGQFILISPKLRWIEVEVLPWMPLWVWLLLRFKFYRPFFPNYPKPKDLWFDAYARFQVVLAWMSPMSTR